MDNAVTQVSATTLVPATPGLGARWQALPGRTQGMAVLGVVALLVVLVVLAGSVKEGNYRVLSSDLSDKDSGQIADRLTQMNVPYRFAEGGGAIMVPASRYHELRAKLAATGMLGTGNTGNELMDKNTFGQTQGQERAKMQRALEGELMTTIQRLEPVKSARVHLALPNQNGFFREQQKPRATVQLALHPGRTLDRGQIAGIVRLVSGSVPEIAAADIGIVDSSGKELSTPADDNAQGLDSQQLQYRRDIEAGHIKRVMALLEPVMGPDNVRATVTAEIDFSQVMQTAEAYRPNQGADAKATVREQRSEESNQPGGNAASGVPGATSNQPQTPPTAPINGPAQALQAAQAGAAAGAARREAATRFEVDKTVTVTKSAMGSVRRLSAAVVVNHRMGTDPKGKATSTPLSEKEIEQLTALLQQGIGFNADRGDIVRVVNAPFRVETVSPVEELPLWKQPWVIDLARSAAAPAALALVACVIVFSLIRPAMTAVMTPPPALPGSQLTETVGGDTTVPGLADQRADALALGAPRTNERLDAVRNLAKENPSAVAQIVRGWVNGEPA